MHYSGPMRVAIDARQLWEMGIGTYVRNLLGGLARAGGRELELTLLLPPRPWRDAWIDGEAARAGFPGAVAAGGESGGGGPGGRGPAGEGPAGGEPAGGELAEEERAGGEPGGRDSGEGELRAAASPADCSWPAAVRWFELTAPKQSMAEQVAVPLRLARERLDLVHAPHYVLPLAVSHPLVVTVHDVIHLLFPEFLTPFRRLIAGRLLALALRRARRVITPSRRTADDVARLYPFASRKLRVVSAGLSAVFAGGAPEPERIASWRRWHALPERYCLAIGAVRPHKNLLHLARAYAASGLGPEVGLVLAGEAPARAPGLLDAIATAGGSGVRFIGRVAEADLPLLYAGATLVALPSLYEGFGLPAVEAMAMGVPVVAAAAGSLPEVVGEAGLLVPPDDLAGWSAALRRVVRDPALRAELGARGREHVTAHHRLERSGAETLAVYREALAS